MFARKCSSTAGPLVIIGETKEKNRLKHVSHILCECPTLAVKRNRLLEEYFLTLDQLSTLDIKHALNYIKIKKCFDNTTNRIGLHV